MFEYRFTVAAPPSHSEPLGYSMAPRTVPTFVSRSINPRPPEQNGTTPIRAEDLDLIEEAAHSERACASEGTQQWVCHEPAGQDQPSRPSRHFDA